MRRSKIVCVFLASSVMWFFSSCDSPLLIRSTLSKSIAEDSGSSGASGWSAYEFVDIPGAVINIVPGGGEKLPYFRGVADEPFNVKDFSIGKYEVSYKQWKEVYDKAGEKSYKFAYGNTNTNDGKPVVWISARDAMVWCNLASELDGLTPVYYYYSNGIETQLKESEKGSRTPPATVSNGSSNGNINSEVAGAGGGAAENAFAKPDANGYRLPTVEEWVLVAKGTNVNAVAWKEKYMAIKKANVDATNSLRELNEYGVISFAEKKHTASVGTDTLAVNDVTLKPISGVYHLLGNVAEYCFSHDNNYNTTLAVCGWDYNASASSNVSDNPMGIVFVDPGDCLPNGLYTGFRVVKNR